MLVTAFFMLHRGYLNLHNKWLGECFQIQWNQKKYTTALKLYISQSYISQANVLYSFNVNVHNKELLIIIQNNIYKPFFEHCFQISQGIL